MADKVIRLFCAAGMSTSLLVNKMKEAAKVAGKDYEIHAHGLSSEEKFVCTSASSPVVFTRANVFKR